MRVVTAADHRMKDWCERCATAASRWYPVDVYDLGGLGFGTTLPIYDSDLSWNHGYLPCRFKIDAIAISISAHEDTVLWLDSDCILQRRVDELEQGRGTPVVVERKEGDVGAGTINTGVIAWPCNFEGGMLLAAWMKLASEMNSEQSALNALYRKSPTSFLLVSSEYNNYYFDGSDAAIVHYKTDKRHLWRA